jgi:3-oxoacyl-[acyl-carrier protein] reductase
MAAAALKGPGGEQRRNESPFGRVATADEVASAIVYPASPQAELATGTVLDFNGPTHLHI